MRLDFQTSPERTARLADESACAALATSRKRDAKERIDEETTGRAEQETIIDLLGKLPKQVFTDRAPFGRVLDGAVKKAGLKLKPALRKAIISTSPRERSRTSKRT